MQCVAASHGRAPIRPDTLCNERVSRISEIMVTDINSNYTSPAGREFTWVAAKCAGINPSSRVLDMGCGYGEGAANLAEDFRCQVTAVDNSEENLAWARSYAQNRGVSHLIRFRAGDLVSMDFRDEPFELILAEGGVLSFISRPKGIQLAHDWLQDRGWFVFSDLVFFNDHVPDEVRNVFEDNIYHYETESSYRRMIKELGFDIHFMSLVPMSGWDNYYAHMARRLEDEKGVFADKQIKMAFHREIDVFYRLEAFRYIGYLFCIARMV
jgi:ubiquinone/menaquinone biosynthesis C-methylase UbiE